MAKRKEQKVQQPVDRKWLRRLFAQNLIATRRRLGVSQESLAYRSSVNRTYCGRVERSEVSTGLDIIARFAIALNVNPEVFFKMPRKKSGRRKPIRKPIKILR
jgi:transcriptional regulator with XRE-family HTH domain